MIPGASTLLDFATIHKSSPRDNGGKSCNKDFELVKVITLSRSLFAERSSKQRTGTVSQDVHAAFSMIKLRSPAH